MPNLADRPTLEHIRSLRTHLMKVWESTWADWEKRDTYYFQTFALWPPEMRNRPTYHPGRSRQIVDAAVDHQLSFEPIPHRVPAGKGEEHKKRADAAEPFLKAVFDEAALLESVLTWKAVGKNLTHLGYAVVEGPVLELAGRPRKPARRAGDADEDYEDQLVLWENARKTWMPFRIRVPSPTQVLLDPEHKSPRFAIKHCFRYSQDLYELTAKRKGRRKDVVEWKMGENPFEPIMCDEYWSPKWHALVANAGSERDRLYNEQDILFVEKNTWGFIPFVHAFSGWGQAPTGEDGNDPIYLAAGILTPAMEMLKLEAQAKAGQHNALMEATFQTMATNIGAEELAAQRARGDYADLPDKSSAWMMDTPQLPAWLFEVMRGYDEDIERTTMSRSLSGQRQVGVSTVGQQAQLDIFAGRKFIAITKQLEHLASVVGSNVLRLVDVLDETLYCRGYKLGPQDIEHDYSVNVTFELTDPVLQLQRQEIGMREVQAGLKSKETYWSSDARLEDATGERERILEDFVRAHPAVQEYLAMLAARSMGLGEVLARQQAGQASGGGNGNQPNAPVLYGPDGMPLLGGSMGRPPINGAGQSGNPLRQPVSPTTAGQPRINPAAFGG